MSELTQVELLWLEKRIENRIRFGRSAEERILDRNRRVLSFAAGSVFAFVRWISNDFGAAVSRIDILRAVATGQRCSTVPYVKPGGEILLRLSGWPKVERVLQLIDAVEALGIDPADAAPDYWHHVHNRLSVNETPRAYTKSRHQAWLHRRKSRTVTTRNRTLAMTIGAVAILAGTIVAKPSPIYIWNSSESVPAWPLSHAHGQQSLRHRTRRHPATRTAGDLPGPKRLFADRSSDVEARAGTSRTNRLQKREHHYGRWHRDGRGAGARQSWPAVAGLGRVRRRRRRKALPHELASRRTLSTGVTSE